MEDFENEKLIKSKKKNLQLNNTKIVKDDTQEHK